MKNRPLILAYIVLSLAIIDIAMFVYFLIEIQPAKAYICGLLFIFVLPAIVKINKLFNK